MRIAILTLVLLLPLNIIADTNIASSVLDGAGRTTAGGTYTLISAIAQPGGINLSTTSTGHANYAGFLNTFSIQPDSDSDNDGLEDEIDIDNDNDNVSDINELTGAGYAAPEITNPNRADTDSDGSSDGDEAIAGTNPNDAGMYLHITEITADNNLNEATVEWQAQGGKTYKVYALDTLSDTSSGTYLGDVTATGGTGPWFSTLTNYTDNVGANTTRFYHIVVPAP